jgi:LPS export ABC transporter protein LptC
MKQQHLRHGLAYLATGLFWVVLMACEEDFGGKKQRNYKGPISEIYDIKMVYSDSSKKVLELQTPVQWQYLNEDKKYPKEVRVFFYDKLGVQTTTVRSDSGKYFRDRNLYKLFGNVVIINTQKGETLQTDELTWNPDLKKIYTDRPVSLRTATESFMGTGLDANQDFSRCVLRRATGNFQSPEGLE